LLIALAASWFLYKKATKLGEMNKWLLYSLMFLRFTVIFFLSFLLISPVIRYLKITFSEPLIIFAQDNSESLSLLNIQTDKEQGTYRKRISDLILDLDGPYDVKTYHFGEKLSQELNFGFNEKETDFDPLFAEIASKYVNHNIGALIIATDGIYNKGKNPVYGSASFPFPVYAIALGDSSKKRDILLKSVYSNNFSFLGDYFPVEVLIEAFGYQGKSAVLRIYNKGKEIRKLEIDFDREDFSRLLKLDIESENKGLQTYTFKVEEKEGEYSHKNNSQNLLIDIYDDKKKILILSYAVHPDIGAIKKALESNKNILVEAYPSDEFTKNIADYQLVIFHQLPSMQNNLQKIARQLTENKIPVLFILGNNSDIQYFNNLKTGVEIKSAKKLHELALPVFDKSFSLFELDEDFKNLLDESPPLSVPFGDYQFTGNSAVLVFQKIKGINTSIPLICFSGENEFSAAKTAIIFGEGIWQWRIKNYMINENHSAFDAFMNKLVNYLSLDMRKDRFMVLHNRIYSENEEIIFRAELYNQAYELVNQPEVSLLVTSESNKEYRFQFSKSGKSYLLNAGRLPVGSYKYQASTVFDKTKFQKSGEFHVVQLNVEQLDLRARHEILKQMALQSGGSFYNINDFERIPGDLKTDENVKKISYSTIDLIDLIQLKWILFLIILLLSTEWFVRKYQGLY
jgi:cellobiose-specific phosphotransferase system component IIB